MSSVETKSELYGLKTMQLNDQKAGMQGLNKELINKIIYEASKGTSYFTFQQKRQERIDRRVKEMLAELEKINDLQKKEALERMDALCVALEAERNFSHSIVHIDMDAFYAAVEIRDNPALKDKPMAVGSISMLSTSNYCARKFGVRAAMPGFIAKKLCPDLIIVPCNFEKYRKVSHQIRDIIKEFDPNYTTMSLDEVYLDLTDYILKMSQENKTETFFSINESFDSSEECDDECELSQLDYEKCQRYRTILSDSQRDDLAYKIVQEIRDKIFVATQLTASAGIAPNTMLAKVCSDQNKPNGQFQIRSNIEEVKKFISTLPVKKVSGIGPVQGQLLNSLGIYTCSDLYEKRDIVDILFTPTSSHFYMRVALGLGSTSLKSDYVRKSIGAEETFKEMWKPEELHQKCVDLCEEVVDDLKSRHMLGKVVVLKIKTVKYETHTRNMSLPFHTSDKEVVIKAAKKLLENEIQISLPEPLKLRLMGIRMVNLVDESSEVNNNKQIKIKDFLQAKSNPTIQSAESEITKDTAFTCPVCNIELEISYTAFNTHVDNCLKRNCSIMSNDTSNLHEINAFPHNSLSSEKQELTNLIVCDGDENGSKAIKNDKNKGINTYENTPGSSQCMKSTVQTEDIVFCPVCGSEQKSNDLVALNAHIDSCLSKSTIKEILSAEAATAIVSEKRKFSSGEQKGKKSKLEDKTMKRIDDYFR